MTSDKELMEGVVKIAKDYEKITKTLLKMISELIKEKKKWKKNLKKLGKNA